MTPTTLPSSMTSKVLSVTAQPLMELIGKANLQAVSLFQELARSQAPFLGRHYPASSVLQACPPPQRPSLLLTEFQLRATTSHRWGFPCCLSILLTHMPSPIPRRDQSRLVAHYSTSGGLPHRCCRSAPALRVSRIAQRSLTLWPACLLTP